MIGDKKTDIEFARRAKIKGYLFKKSNLNRFIEEKIFNQKI
jgi:histidinol phosphatase-like enzyme